MYASEEFIEKIWGKSQIPRPVDNQTLERAGPGPLRSKTLKLTLTSFSLKIYLLSFCSVLEFQGLKTFPGNLIVLVWAMETPLSPERVRGS